MPTEEPRELELKYQLAGEGDYRLLLDNCPRVVGRKTATFENYYFDSPDHRLAARGGMLRLRYDGELTLCFKLGGEKEGQPGYFDALEVEANLETSLLKEALKNPDLLGKLKARPVEALWEHFNEMELSWIGELTTVRRYRQIGEFLLELDEVIYGDGGVSFEVEIETRQPEKARRALSSHLAQLGIEGAPQRRSKLQGLLHRKGISPG
tara:strand:+ start:49 stop:675 length:627 start_codon:yes stop_codon:yes gene_type:complete